MGSSDSLTDFKKIQMWTAISNLLDNVTQPHCRLSSAKSLCIVLIQKARRAEML